MTIFSFSAWKGATRALALTATLMLGLLPARAAEFVVRNTDDSGVDSLRQAILDANGVDTNDTIIFDATVFDTARIINLDSTGLALANNGSLTITGPGAGLLSVRPRTDFAFPVFTNNSTGATLSGLTITRGARGIGNNGTLTLLNCVVTDNQVALGFGDGGGIFNGGTLRMTGCVVSANRARANGGGISSSGSLSMLNCSVSGNTSSVPTGSNLGGGILASGGTVNLTGCTVSGNTATGAGSTGAGRGGGIYVASGTATLNASNCTVFGNTATATGTGTTNQGGGIYLSVGVVNLRNCSVSGNRANNGGGGLYRLNGGFNVGNTIVAGNMTNTVNVSVDVFGTFTSQGNNLIGNTSGSSSFTNGSNGDQVGTSGAVKSAGFDPAGFKNYGGPTETLALAAGSAAINAGNNALIPDDTLDSNGNTITTGEKLPFDQRGTGFARIVGGVVDIGAFEVQPTVSIGAGVGVTGSTRISGVTATTDVRADFGNLNNTVNGNGLSELSLSATHAGYDQNNCFGSFSTTTGDFTFGLGGSKSVSGFSFWNADDGFGSAAGIRDVRVFYSTDGISFMPVPGAPTQFARVSGNGNQPPQRFAFPAITATKILFEVTANHGDPDFLSFFEVAFASAPATGPLLEGNSGVTSTASFPVTLSAAASQAVTVNYRTSNGTATAGSDYVGVTGGELVIPAGQTSGNILVTVNGDTLAEVNETFSVTLSGATGATLGTPGSGTATIVDDDLGVLSITRLDPNPNQNDSVRFLVTFNQSVTGVDAADFDFPLEGLSIGSTPVVSPDSGATRTVTVRGISGQSGRIGLNLRADASVNGTGVSSGFTTGEVYTRNNLASSPVALISEFRFHGPTSDDEYVEIVNTTGAPLSIVGWKLRTNTGTGEEPIPQTATIEAGTAPIPPFGHFLFTGTGYAAGALPSYGASNLSLGADASEDSGAALVDLNGQIQDAVGFASGDPTLRKDAGLPSAPNVAGQYTWMRDFSGALPKNTGNSASDFVFLSNNGASVPGSSGAIAAQLGAPNPESLSSPVNVNSQVVITLLQPEAGLNNAPNRLRTGSGNGGTLLLRRTIRNTGSQPLSRVRLLMTRITSQGSPTGIVPGTQADVRLISSGNESIALPNRDTNGVIIPAGQDGAGTTLTPVYAALLEAPSNATSTSGTPVVTGGGGGLGSSVVFDLTFPTPLLPNTSANYGFNLQVATGGTYLVAFNVLGITAAAP